MSFYLMAKKEFLMIVFELLFSSKMSKNYHYVQIGEVVWYLQTKDMHF